MNEKAKDGTITDGEPLSSSGSSRTTYIGKEKDRESGFGDFGVRKYSDAHGRFMQTEPYDSFKTCKRARNQLHESTRGEDLNKQELLDRGREIKELYPNK